MDPGLVKAALKGNRGAQGALWRELRPLVESTVRRVWRGASIDDVADLTQDLAIGLLLGRHPELAQWNSTRPLEPWLNAVVANAVRDRARSSATGSRATAALLEVAGDGVRALEPGAAAASREQVHLVRKELERLSHTDAEIIRGLLAGLTQAQAAARVGRGRRTAIRAKHRLSDRLRAVIDARDPRQRNSWERMALPTGDRRREGGASQSGGRPAHRQPK